MPDVTTEDLIRLWMDAHNQAKSYRRQGHHGAHLAATKDAKRYLEQAHTQDPEHLDPAWARARAHKFHPDSCMSFYDFELEKDATLQQARLHQALKKGPQIIAESVSARGTVH